MADPTTLGSYTVESVIFRGQIATSYLAAHTVMRGQRVVLRVLNPEAAADKDRVARFETEARNAARLKHECIAGVVDLQRDGDSPFLVLEYAEGLDVSTLLSTFGAMPPTVAGVIAREVLRGLEHAHGLGMMHSKLRPRRVKVSPEGGVKVLGLGVRDSDGVNENETDSAYMAPEVVTGGGESVQADLYSVGVLLYHMVSARVPVRGADGRVPSLADTNPIIPRPLSDVVDFLIEGKPSSRPADAKSARAALDDVLEAMRVIVGADLIRDYLANPKSFTERARQEAISSLLRVARDLNDGPPPDPQAARRVVERVLEVDPGNEAATTFLSELDGDSSDRTMMMPAGGMPSMPPRVPTPPPAAAAPPPPAPKPAAPAPPKSEVKPAAPAAPKPEIRSEVKSASSAPKSEVKPAAAPRSEVAPPKSSPMAEKPAPRAEKPTERKAAAAPAPANKNMGLLIGIGVVVVALIVALVLVLGKKKPAEEVATGEPTPAATASLDVSTDPVGAVVTVEAGGSSQTNTSNTTFDNLAEGTARVRVELAGFLARETTLAVTAGSAQSLHMALLPDAAAQVCSVYVAVTPKAEKVLINGKPASGKETMFWAVVPAGKYKVEASAAGFTTALSKGSANAGEVKKVTLTLASAPAAVAAAGGATPGAPGAAGSSGSAVVPVTEDPADGQPVRIEVTPNADIFVNHVLRAKSAAFVDVKLAPGKWDVVFEHPDFPKVRKEVQVKAGKTTKPLRVDLAAGEGGISVRGGKAGLKIYVDGRSSGVTTPGVVRGLKPGRHTIELRESNGTTVVATQSVVISDSPQNQPVQF